MRELVFGDEVSDEPVDAAQQIMYDAWEAEGPQQQLALARKALDTSPDCADAYVLLAEMASSLPEAIDFYEQGVAAGARGLGRTDLKSSPIISGGPSRLVPICGRAKDWPNASGSLADATRPSSIIAKCCG